MLFACFALTGCGCSKREFSVKFDSRGGSSVSSQTVSDGELATKPADPVRDGYSFGGWFLDLDDEDAFDFNTKISKDITLYAKWGQRSSGEPCTKSCDDGYTLDTTNCSCVKKGDSSDSKDVPVSSVKLNKKSTSLTVGKSESLKLTISPSNASNKVASWKSSDESVVKVDKSGKITAVGVGSATVTVTVDGVSTSISVTVNKAVPVESISISGDNTVKVKKSITLKATINPSDATDKTLTWSSSDKNIATVDSKGVVTGVKAGKVTITVKASNGVSASYVVTVEDESAYVVTLTAQKQATGEIRQYLVSVSNSGKAVDFTRFVYNGKEVLPSSTVRYLNADKIDKSITSVDLVLTDGKTVKATVKYA